MIIFNSDWLNGIVYLNLIKIFAHQILLGSTHSELFKNVAKNLNKEKCKNRCITDLECPSGCITQNTTMNHEELVFLSLFSTIYQHNLFQKQHIFTKDEINRNVYFLSFAVLKIVLIIYNLLLT